LPEEFFLDAISSTIQESTQISPIINPRRITRRINLRRITQISPCSHPTSSLLPEEFFLDAISLTIQESTQISHIINPDII
jgi:hypothetical protein